MGDQERLNDHDRRITGLEDKVGDMRSNLAAHIGKSEASLKSVFREMSSTAEKIDAAKRENGDKLDELAENVNKIRSAAMHQSGQLSGMHKLVVGLGLLLGSIISILTIINFFRGTGG